MGSERTHEERPIREVNVPEFFIGAFEITKAQWAAVAKMPKINIKLEVDPSPEQFKEKMPVVNVSWEEAEEFCARLSRLTGRRYSLPSEAEWEYAARAGTDTIFAFGSKIRADLVNFNAAVISNEAVKGDFRNSMIEVGSLGIANKFGLFDMHGNVAEWCQDGWVDTYKDAPLDGSYRAGDPTKKVVRGGSFKLLANAVCSSCRASQIKFLNFEVIGFRVVMRTPIVE